MFNSEQAKAIGNAVRQQPVHVMPVLWKAFADSIIGERSEVRFFDKLIVAIESGLQSLNLPGLGVHV